MKTLLILFFSTLLLSTQAETSQSHEFLTTCSDGSTNFADQESSSNFVNRIVSELIQNTQVKDALLGASSELEKVKEKLSKCTEALLKHNQFKALENLISKVADPLDLDLSNELRTVGNKIKKDIDTIITLAQSKRNTQVITPAIYWVQSKDNLIMQIKFAHRHDAPGCLEVKNEVIKFTESGLEFSAFCVQGMQPMQFKLDLPFYKNINPEESTWNMESVGRMFVNVTKAEPEVWVYILKDNEKLPNSRVWWEMKDQYKEDMKEYDRLLEEDIENQSSKKKKKKSKKTEDTQTNEPAEPVNNDGRDEL